MFARIPAPDERGRTVKWNEQLRRYRLASPSFGLQSSKPTSVRAWVQARPQSSATPELSSPETWARRAYRNLIYFNEAIRAATSRRGKSWSFWARSHSGPCEYRAARF